MRQRSNFRLEILLDILRTSEVVQEQSMHKFGFASLYFAAVFFRLWATEWK